MKNRLSHSIFIAVIGIFLGFAYWVARFGFDDNSFFLVFKVVGTSFFLIFAPNIVDLIRSRLKAGEFWYNSPPFISIAGLLILVLLGLVAPKINLFCAVWALGWVFFVAGLYFYFKLSEKKTAALAVCLFAFVFSLWVIGVTWGGNYLNPLFFEKIALGSVHIDTLFHSAISSMIATHWIPSTGLNGLPYLRYHWGSHYVFAQISKLFSLGVLDFYNLAYPVIFIPFIVRSFIYLVDAIRSCLKVRLSLNWKFYLLLILAFTSVLPTDLIGKMGIGTVDIFVSESYCLGLAFAFLLLSLVFQLKHQLDLKKTPSNIAIFFVIFFPLILGLTGLFKISIFILLSVAFAYFFVRLKLYRKMFFCLCAVFCLAIAAVIFKYSYFGEGSKQIIFSYSRSWVNADFRPFFLLTYFFWVWVYLAIRLKLLGATLIKDLGRLFKERKILDLELLFVVALVGIAPGMLFDIPGGGASYFSDFQRWLALSFILALMSLWWPKSKLKLSTACFALIIIIAAYNSSRNIEDKFVRGFVYENIKIRVQLTSNQSGARKLGHLKYLNFITQKYIPANKAIALTAPQVQKSLEGNKKYQLIKFLKAQSNLPGKNKTAVFIPQENSFYWNLADYRKVHFVAPFLTGMPLLGGVQPFVPAKLTEKAMQAQSKYFDSEQMKTLTAFYQKANDDPAGEYLLKKDLSNDEKITIYNLMAPDEYQILVYYGYWSYGFPSEAEYLERFSGDEKICNQAMQKNFSQVLIITSDQDSNTQSRLLGCK